MKATTINNFGKIIAFMSFGFGLFLFLTFLAFKSPILHGVLAVVYFVISTILNIGTLAILLINALINEDHRKNSMLTVLLLIINIPIQLVFFMLILSS